MGGDGLPPVTMALVGMNWAPFLAEGGYLLKDVSLIPRRVIERGEYSRLVKATVSHVSLQHMVSEASAHVACPLDPPPTHPQQVNCLAMQLGNMSAAVVDCAYLERRLGSLGLLTTLLE